MTDADKVAAIRKARTWPDLRPLLSFGAWLFIAFAIWLAVEVAIIGGTMLVHLAYATARWAWGIRL